MCSSKDVNIVVVTSFTLYKGMIGKYERYLQKSQVLISMLTVKNTS